MSQQGTPTRGLTWTTSRGRSPDSFGRRSATEPSQLQNVTWITVKCRNRRIDIFNQASLSQRSSTPGSTATGGTEFTNHGYLFGTPVPSGDRTIADSPGACDLISIDIMHCESSNVASSYGAATRYCYTAIKVDLTKLC